MTAQPKRIVKPIPDGYHSVTTYLTVPGVAKLMEFLKQAFGAVEIERMQEPGGRVGHAQMKIGDTLVMMGEPQGPGQQPKPCNLYLYVEDVDAVYQRAIAAGGKSISEVKDQFYGDRSGGVEDLSGNGWWIATHIEDVSSEEIARRAQALHGQH
jgi:PhnB protein